MKFTFKIKLRRTFPQFTTIIIFAILTYFSYMFSCPFGHCKDVRKIQIKKRKFVNLNFNVYFSS